CATIWRCSCTTIMRAPRFACAASWSPTAWADNRAVKNPDRSWRRRRRREGAGVGLDRGRSPAASRRIMQSSRPENDNAGPKARERSTNRRMRPFRSERRAPRSAAPRSAGPGDGLGLHRQQPFALQPLAGELARTANGCSLFARLLLGGFFVMAAELHLAENALALHLLLERLEGLIDIVVADENLQTDVPFLARVRVGPGIEFRHK